VREGWKAASAPNVLHHWRASPLRIGTLDRLRAAIPTPPRDRQVRRMPLLLPVGTLLSSHQSKTTIDALLFLDCTVRSYSATNAAVRHTHRDTETLLDCREASSSERDKQSRGSRAPFGSPRRRVNGVCKRCPDRNIPKSGDPSGVRPGSSVRAGLFWALCNTLRPDGFPGSEICRVSALNVGRPSCCLREYYDPRARRQSCRGTLQA